MTTWQSLGVKILFNYTVMTLDASGLLQYLQPGIVNPIDHVIYISTTADIATYWIENQLKRVRIYKTIGKVGNEGR